MGHHFSNGQTLATNAWRCIRKGHTSATGHLHILGGRVFCDWSDDATLQEKLDAGSKLFQAKSLYHPALHRFLEELSGFLEMAAVVCSEAEKQHAAKESGSGDAFRAVRSLIDLGESDDSERVFLANLSEDDFVAHCQGFKDVSQVQIALGLRGYADQRIPWWLSTVFFQ